MNTLWTDGPHNILFLLDDQEGQRHRQRDNPEGKLLLPLRDCPPGPPLQPGRRGPEVCHQADLGHPGEAGPSRHWGWRQQGEDHPQDQLRGRDSPAVD